MKWNRSSFKARKFAKWALKRSAWVGRGLAAVRDGRLAVQLRSHPGPHSNPKHSDPLTLPPLQRIGHIQARGLEVCLETNLQTTAAPQQHSQDGADYGSRPPSPPATLPLLDSEPDVSSDLEESAPATTASSSPADRGKRAALSPAHSPSTGEITQLLHRQKLPAQP